MRFRIRLVFSYRRSKKTVVLYCVLYLKAVSIFLIFVCQLFFQKCDILLGRGPRFVTVCDRGGGVKNHQKKRDILYGRPLTLSIVLIKTTNRVYSFRTYTQRKIYCWSCLSYPRDYPGCTALCKLRRTLRQFEIYFRHILRKSCITVYPNVILVPSV